MLNQSFRLPTISEVLAVEECYSQLDGSRTDWKYILPIFESAINTDLTCETENSSLNYEEYIEAVKAFHNAGGVVEQMKCFKDTPNTVQYSMWIRLPKGFEKFVESKGTFGADGKLIHMQSSEAEHFARAMTLTNTSLRMDIDMPKEIQELANNFPNCAGTGKEWRDIKPLFDQLFHHDLQYETMTGVMDNDMFRVVVEDFSKAGEMEIGNVVVEHKNRIIFSIRTTMLDGKIWLLDRSGTFKEGKLVHIGPVDDVVCQELFDPFRRKAGQEAPEISDIKDYFSLFNGSTEGWDDFHILFKTLFHPTLKFATTKGEAIEFYQTWFKFSKALKKVGATVKLNAILKTQDHITYSGVVLFPGGDQRPFESKATYREGQIVRIQPTNVASSLEVLMEGVLRT